MTDVKFLVLHKTLVIIQLCANKWGKVNRRIYTAYFFLYQTELFELELFDEME